MRAITVTTTPQSVADLLGLDDATPHRSVVWSGTAQNVDGTETIYRLRSVTRPVPTDPAFRHPAGDRWEFTVYSADLGVTWVWCDRDEAIMVLESPGL